MKVKKICQYCGKEYFVANSQAKRSKFCSDYCFRKSKNTQVDCECAYCGQAFKVQYGKYKKFLNENKRLFCSRKSAIYHYV